MPRSFSEPKTEFKIVKSDTPPTVEGIAIGEQRSEVACRDCGQVGQNVEEIYHQPDCNQRWVRSEFCRMRFNSK
jgi:Zn finger protein HypA/HybF involved in hydrogenase expression